jgi:hypothetical protein
MRWGFIIDGSYLSQDLLYFLTLKAWRPVHIPRDLGMVSNAN